MVLEIRSLSEFNKLKKNPLLVIDFYATWCGPCKAISPMFEKLAKQHEGSKSIIFAKVDVDKARDVSQELGITAMPTFKFFRNGQEVDQVRGADPNGLTKKIGTYTEAALKEAPATTTVADAKSAGPASLRSLIDVASSRLLNTSTLSSIKNIQSPPPAGYAVASAAASGAQFLIHLNFTQAVTPSLIKLTISKDSQSNAPSRVQAGSNVPVKITKTPEGVETNDLEFESLSKAENTQSFNVYSDEYNDGKTELKLKASKFTGIKSLTLRVDANLSGEPKTISKIGELDIIGTKA
ncbi:thiol-disulfide exchange intermediate [Bisporella sp. PMI_857]|nr:thiol-disulfide exchange intermediate [Bisporella sp. PMI_857]